MKHSDHGPIQPELIEVMNDMGRAIDRIINRETWPTKKYGFCLLMFKMGEAKPGDRMNYLSNATRETMLAAMKEFIAHAEGRYYGDPTKKQ